MGAIQKMQNIQNLITNQNYLTNLTYKLGILCNYLYLVSSKHVTQFHKI